jgi:hypothetical protein
MGISIALFASILLLHMKFGRRFVSFSPLAKTDEVSFPLERREVEDDIDREIAEEIRKEIELSEWSEQQRLRNARGVSPWRCTKCREENPGTFELCWKCNEGRSAAGI